MVPPQICFKLDEARFFLSEMHRDISTGASDAKVPAYSALASAPGTIVGNLWQDRFYFHLDAFLAATRSIPDIIQTWYGRDPNPRNPVVRSWYQNLSPKEKIQRESFQRQFSQRYVEFARHPLSRLRNVTVHGYGIPPVRVEVTGLFGVVHHGGPTQPVPVASALPDFARDHMRPATPDQGVPLTPNPSGFFLRELSCAGTVRDRPLFPACEEYLKAVEKLATEAEALVVGIHTESITPPPLLWESEEQAP